MRLDLGGGWGLLLLSMPTSLLNSDQNGEGGSFTFSPTRLMESKKDGGLREP